MSRVTCSIVMASYERAHLLVRSLECYARQDFPKAELELVVVDDHSTDGTAQLVKNVCLDHDINYTLVTTGPKKQAWRDCGAVLNAGIRASTGQHIILTHPEVMPGRRSVAECVSRLAEFEHFRRSIAPMVEGPLGMYACCKPYYLTPRDQERIDTVNWLDHGALEVRKVEGFYDKSQHTGGNPDYTPWSIESVGKPGAQHSHWLSWVFGGCSRRTWKELGGMLETQRWGSCDVAFVQRRRLLGIMNHTCTDDDTLVIHQNHSGPNDMPTPRIEEVWKQELAGLPMHDPQKMRYPACDYLGWHD